MWNASAAAHATQGTALDNSQIGCSVPGGLQRMKRMELKGSNMPLSYKRQGRPTSLCDDVDNGSRQNQSIAKYSCPITVPQN